MRSKFLLNLQIVSYNLMEERNSYISERIKLCKEFSCLADFSYVAIAKISAGGDFLVSQKIGLAIITYYTIVWCGCPFLIRGRVASLVRGGAYNLFFFKNFF